MSVLPVKRKSITGWSRSAPGVPSGSCGGIILHRDGSTDGYNKCWIANSFSNGLIGNILGGFGTTIEGDKGAFEADEATATADADADAVSGCATGASGTAGATTGDTTGEGIAATTGAGAGAGTAGTSTGSGTGAGTTGAGTGSGTSTGAGASAGSGSGAGAGTGSIIVFGWSATCAWATAPAAAEASFLLMMGVQLTTVKVKRINNRANCFIVFIVKKEEKKYEKKV